MKLHPAWVFLAAPFFVLAVWGWSRAEGTPAITIDPDAGYWFEPDDMGYCFATDQGLACAVEVQWTPDAGTLYRVRVKMPDLVRVELPDGRLCR